MTWQATIDSADLQKEGHLLLSVTFTNEADGKKEVRQIRAANSSQILDLLRAERDRLTGFKEVAIPIGTAIDLNDPPPEDDAETLARKAYQAANQRVRIAEAQFAMGQIDQSAIDNERDAAKALFKPEYLGTVI